MKEKLLFTCLIILFCGFLPVNSAEIQPKTASLIQQKTPEFIDNMVNKHKNEVKIIFSDIDDTLIPLSLNGKETSTPQIAKDEIKLLQKENIPIVLATGRARNEISHVIKDLNLTTPYLILLQGSEIIDLNGNILYHDGVPAKDVFKMEKEFYKIVKKNNLTSNFYIVINGAQYGTKFFTMPYNGKCINVIKSYEDFGHNFIAGKVILYDSNTKSLKILQKEMKEKFPKYQIVISAHGFCDITSPSATKGNAIKQVAKWMKIDLKNAAAFGDAENDISMLNTVKKEGGLSVAVENALPKLKENADFVTKPVTSGGEYYAIQKILLNNKLLKQKNEIGVKF